MKCSGLGYGNLDLKQDLVIICLILKPDNEASHYQTRVSFEI